MVALDIYKAFVAQSATQVIANYRLYHELSCWVSCSSQTTLSTSQGVVDSYYTKVINGETHSTVLCHSFPQE